MADPVEIELKFQVPAAARDGLRRTVATASAVTTRLQAVYADTADDRLAHAALALRLRKEGRVWVQTLKGRGDGLMQRLEHELRLPPQRGEPLLDPARHAGTVAGVQLDALLADGAVLQPVYRTDIRRTHRRVRNGGAVIEIAFDEGVILAAGRRLAVCEIEFELLSGPPRALIDLASRWVQRHGLWLDVRTKSERGHRLARGLDSVPALRATRLELHRSASPGDAFAAIVHASLGQMLPNAAELAGGSGTPEHLHQLRVAMRRLRSALRLYAGWSAEPEAAQALEQRLREPFARLGAARDQDALAAALLPSLAAAGGPPLRWPEVAAEDPAAVVREPAFTLTVLQALRLSLPGFSADGPAGKPAGKPGYGPADGPADESADGPADGPAGQEQRRRPSLREAARVALKTAFRQAMRDAERFASIDVQAQHRTRKRLKRFRYGAEFVQSLFPGKATKQALGALRKALDALGAYNDVVVAEQRFAALVETDPRAWFALGWLASRRELLQAGAARSLRRLDKAPRFWR